jgi:hypothetical protein
MTDESKVLATTFPRSSATLNTWTHFLSTPHRFPSS